MTSIDNGGVIWIGFLLEGSMFRTFLNKVSISPLKNYWKIVLNWLIDYMSAVLALLKQLNHVQNQPNILLMLATFQVLISYTFFTNSVSSGFFTSSTCPGSFSMLYNVTVSLIWHRDVRKRQINIETMLCKPRFEITISISKRLPIWVLTSATLDKVKSILKHRENTVSQGLHLNDKKIA